MAGFVIKSYRDLLVWQKSMALSVDCYHLTKAFPKDEIYGMTSQIRRASVSIAANLAEGHDPLLAATDELGRMLRALIRSLQSKVGEQA